MNQNKRRARKVKPRHWLLLLLIRLLFAVPIFIYFHFRIRYFRLRKKGPLLVLVNHATEFDVLLTDTMFDFPLYFVASEQLLNKGFVSWLLDYVFAPIPKSKSMSDISIVPRIMRVLNEGGNVCIFPEGNMTMTGTVSSMPPAIGKLIKLLKVPVVFMETYGLYFSSPRWSRYRKFGPTGMKLKRFLEPREYEEMTGDELTELVRRELHVNAFEQRPLRKYRGFRKAEGLERLLFTCPECGDPFSMKTRHSDLYCEKCGYRATYDIHGYVNDKHGRHTTVELDEANKKRYIGFVGANLATIRLSHRCAVHYFIAGAKRRSKKFHHTLTVDAAGLSIDEGGAIVRYGYDEILSFTMQTRRKFIIYVPGNRSIVAKLPETASSYQYLITMQLLQNHHLFEKGAIDHELIAHPDDASALGL